MRETLEFRLQRKFEELYIKYRTIFRVLKVLSILCPIWLPYFFGYFLYKAFGQNYNDYYGVMLVSIFASYAIGLASFMSIAGRGVMSKIILFILYTIFSVVVLGFWAFSLSIPVA